jgi:UDP-N-acetyl-D-galactosamine dehydrogenase
MIRGGITVKDSRVLVMGITFKENCPDTRNTRVVDIVRGLTGYGCAVDIYDPWAIPEEVQEEYGIELLNAPPVPSASYQAFVLAVAHSQFQNTNPRDFLTPEGIVYDVKGFYPKELTDRRL